MEQYQRYKTAYPLKSDVQIIDLIGQEVSDKVETMHKLLERIEFLEMQEEKLNQKIESYKVVLR